MWFSKKNISEKNNINITALSFEEFVQKVKDKGEVEIAEMIETRKFFIENNERVSIYTNFCICKRMDFDARKTFLLTRPPLCATWSLIVIDYNHNTKKIIC